MDEGYDGRIKAAVEHLDVKHEAQAAIGRFRHVFVDEIQDLVGIRTELVERVLRHAGGGFTLFGDPAQAIYDYQISAPEISLFDAVRLWYPEELIELSLNQNHRAETDVTKKVLEVGRSLARENPDYRTIGEALLDLANDLDMLGSPDQAAVALRRVRASTAILCRDNGRALLLSEKLRSLEVDHRLQRSASDRATAPWVGRAFRSVKHLVTGRIAVERLLASEVPDAIDPAVGWDLLKQLDRSPGNQLDLDRVRRAVAINAVPDALAAPPQDLLIISTIHRAKGLEFDAVILLRTNDRLDDFLYAEDEPELALGTRVLYVALSRPRRLLMNLSDSDGVRIGLDRASGRWIRRGWQKWQTFGFEVDVDDIDKSAPPGALIPDANAEEIQDYLWSDVFAGDSAELHFLKETVAGSIYAIYAVLHNDRPIGTTSPQFGTLLHRRLHKPEQRGKWPHLIKGLRIEGMETVAGSPATSANHGLGDAGLWLRPRLVGLGEFEW
jgi:hypothetical protein